MSYGQFAKRRVSQWSVVSCQWSVPVRHDFASGEMFVACVPPLFRVVRRSGTQAAWYSSTHLPLLRTTLRLE